MGRLVSVDGRTVWRGPEQSRRRQTRIGQIHGFVPSVAGVSTLRSQLDGGAVRVADDLPQCV